MAEKRIYRSLRDLHLYAGLFIGPFVLVFALSVVSLNHRWLPWGGARPGYENTRREQLALPPIADNLELAKEIQRRIGITGEIDFIRRNEDVGRVSFPITAPGYRAEVDADLRSGTASITESRSGLWDAVNYLHKMPGPHNVAVRGNWIGTRAWAWFADTTVYLLLFLTATGLYLWIVSRSERRTGLIFLTGGVASFFIIVLSIVGVR